MSIKVQAQFYNKIISITKLWIKNTKQMLYWLMKTIVFITLGQLMLY